MSNNQNGNGEQGEDPNMVRSNAHGHNHGPPPQQGQAWYPQQPNQMTSLPMDPAAYAYQGQPGMAGYDGFDYGLGSLGMGMDGAISGLFMADGLWSAYDPQQAQQNPQLFPGWS
jgi:hypothetical protein